MYFPNVELLEMKVRLYDESSLKCIRKSEFQVFIHNANKRDKGLCLSNKRQNTVVSFLSLQAQTALLGTG